MQVSELWSVVRDDPSDSYQIIDQAEQIVAVIPIGTKPALMAAQRRSRDLIVAAPAMRQAIIYALAQLEHDKPNLAAVKTVLDEALLASRGQA
jgi:hypothetical protein